VEIVNSFIPDSNCVHTYIEIKTQINGIYDINLKKVSTKLSFNIFFIIYILSGLVNQNNVILRIKLQSFGFPFGLLRLWRFVAIFEIL
jgi:hypothetical protein